MNIWGYILVYLAIGAGMVTMELVRLRLHDIDEFAYFVDDMRDFNPVERILIGLFYVMIWPFLVLGVTVAQIYDAIGKGKERS